jgi:glucose/arabinose dehydrogenase
VVLPATIEAVRVAAGLSQPLFATAPAGDPARLFVVEKAGRIGLLDLATNTLAPAPFLDLSGTLATLGEQGLLGLAFHPGYATNRRFFVNLTNAAGDTEIHEYRVSADPARADPASARLVLGIDQPAGLSNHKGGWIGFGPDGALYVATGDGGGTGDPSGNGQNTRSLLGKMLRLQVDGGDAFPDDPSRNYAIPPDNPFASGGAGAPEVWAWGLRNPWRAAFDRATGALWIGDVGQERFEEIDLGAKGANYGWNRFEGPVPFLPGVEAAGLTPPLFAYGREVGTTVTGGYIYRGPGDALQGTYVFADFGSGRVFSLARRADGAAAVTDLTDRLAFEPGAQLNRPVSFGEDALGRLYVVDFDGEVFRLTPRANTGEPVGGIAPFGMGRDTPLEYIASHPDLIAAFGTNGEAGRSHFARFGMAEGRTVRFDGFEYIASYPDLIAAFGAGQDAGAAHFITFGRAEVRAVTFDGYQYIASHADLRAAFGADDDAGAAHFIAHGRAEGRSADLFDAARYLANYADLRAAFGADEEAAAIHFIAFGAAEGRTDDPLIG